MRPTQRVFFKKLIKWLAIALVCLFVYYHPIAALIIVLSVIGVGVLLLLFIQKILDRWNDTDFKSTFK